jgi:DUF971 family protein
MYSQLDVAVACNRSPEARLTSRNDEGLELDVGGYLLRFPAVWLRDNCPCADCLDPGSGQKLNDITELPDDLAVSAAEDAGDWVVVTFAPDGHRSSSARAAGSAESGSTTGQRGRCGCRTRRSPRSA